MNLPVTAQVRGQRGSVAVVSAAALPGAVPGVWQADLQFPGNGWGAVPVSLFVATAQGRVALREAELTVWLR